MKLVIGYGNELRGDDGVGPCIARAVASWGRPEVRVIETMQLLPEMAEELSACEEVIFVDASVTAREVEVKEVSCGPLPGLGHHGSPAGLLALTERVYGKRPTAWLVSVPGQDFGLGAEMSERAKEGMVKALAEIRRLLGG